MIALLLLAVEPAAVTPDVERFETCMALAETDPARALDQASSWRLAGGGVLARQCEGLAYVIQKRWAPAATAFESAAREAEIKGDGRAANLWVQAGNAALAGNDPKAATAFFDRALARAQLTDEALGEAHLDRARARAAFGDLQGARADLDLALRHVPADPLGWLLSATLARRMNDLARAQIDIAQAATLSPDDASVALEAGNIAVLSGRDDAARTAWEAAIRLQPNSPRAKSAADQLARLAASR